MLRRFHGLPPGFIEAPAETLYRLVGGPCLIHLSGRREPPLFVSVLLHGNERTGLEAVQALLAKYHQRELPRALSVFVGNVDAARHGLRRLDHQPDFNRVWPGCGVDDREEHAMMCQVVDEMTGRGVFASVDVHNNTGLNPHYGCVNVIDDRFLHLATLFSRTVVYFVTPTGVQSAAFAPLCPAVTVECGQSGQEHSREHAFEYLDACMNLAEIPTHPVAAHDIDLFHTVAQVKVPETLSFGFDASDADVRFERDIDHLNFRELAAGTVLGTVRDGARLEAWDESGREVGEGFFVYDGGDIRLKRAAMPSMLTLDERIIRQDCLCYLMERYPLDRQD